jgi:cysteine desulfurase
VLDKRVDVRPLISGGGQERGLRSGTENVAAIVGFGVACELAVVNLGGYAADLTAMRRRLEGGLVQLGAEVFSSKASRLPNTSFFSVSGIDGETLVAQLDRAGFAVASGSACSSASPEPSRTLVAMGVAEDIARGAIRVSLGRGNREDEVDRFLDTLLATIARLKQMTAMTV